MTGLVMAWKRTHDKELAVLHNRHIISASPVVNLTADKRNAVS
jgi:hypothetical protein